MDEIEDIYTIFDKYSDNYTTNLNGTDKNTVHNYLFFYNKLFKNMRMQSLNILEIGILSGASLVAWSEYFQNSKIYGVDIDLTRIKFEFNDRIQIFQGNSSDNTIYTTLKNTVGYMDIIIEDASHSLEDQLKAIEYTTILLKKGGLLILEDVQSFESMPILKAKAIENNFSFDYIDNRKSGRYDDILAILTKL
jgi:23S rRNA U2552 (ribose-2'-O)-methylase RlmE/FtsJ